MLLKTNRLMIEHFKDSDTLNWTKIESDADVRRFVDAKVLYLKEAGEYVEMNIRLYQTHGYGRYAVRLKENRKLIGICGFLNKPYGIDYGYRYSKDNWGKGFGFEAAKEVLEYDFSELELEKVAGLTAEQNIGSIRILEKLRFKFEHKLALNKTKSPNSLYTSAKFE